MVVVCSGSNSIKCAYEAKSADEPAYNVQLLSDYLMTSCELRTSSQQVYSGLIKLCAYICQSWCCCQASTPVP